MCIWQGLKQSKQKNNIEDQHVQVHFYLTVHLFIIVWFTYWNKHTDQWDGEQMNQTDRQRGRQWHKAILEQSRHVADYGAEYGQSSLAAFQAECTMLFLRNHFGHPLHCPFQNVLFTLGLSIEQPSHNSGAVAHCFYIYICMRVSVCPKLFPAGNTTPSLRSLSRRLSKDQRFT